MQVVSHVMTGEARNQPALTTDMTELAKVRGWAAARGELALGTGHSHQCNIGSAALEQRPPVAGAAHDFQAVLSGFHRSPAVFPGMPAVDELIAVTSDG